MKFIKLAKGRCPKSHLIICLSHIKKHFQNNFDKNTTKYLDFHPEIEFAPKNLRNVILSDVTNSVARLRRMQVITSPRSKYMISGYQPGRADSQRAGNSVSHIQTLGYLVKYSLQYVIR